MDAPTHTVTYRPGTSAAHILGCKLDSIPFSGYHMLVIGVLALVGFIEGYDLVITGSLLVLAKAPLHLSGSDIRWLAVGPTFMLCVGGFAASAVSDHWSRKRVMLIGVIATTFCTLLIPLVQTAEQLILLRLLTGLGAGGAVSAAFPIAAGGRVYVGAVFGVPALHRPQRVSSAGPAGRAGSHRRSGAGLVRHSGKPALASGPWPAANGSRHRQPHHSAERRQGAAVDGAGPRRPYEHHV
jgi:hypothetical protein